MDVGVLDIIKGEFLATCPDISLLIPVGPDDSIDAADKHVASYIEFPLEI